MKETRTAKIQRGILAVLGVALLLTLVLPELPQREKKTAPLSISVIMRESDTTAWSSARLGMEEAAGALGVELRFLTPTTANNGAEQNQLARREAENGAKALVIIPAEPESLDREMASWDSHCPVVSVESALEKSVLSVTPDNAQVGRAAAEELLADWTGGAVLLLETGGRGSGVSQRLEAARVRLSQAGVPCIQRRADAARLNESLSGLLRETEARWVMTFGPLATAQAAAGKETSGWTQPLYGAGVTMRVATALERGTVTAAVAWSDYAAGYLAVQGAAQAARGQDPAKEAVPFLVVRGDEIYAPENEKLLFPVTY